MASYLVAIPELLSSAAADVESIESAVHAANAAVAGPTTTVVAAAADEVSAAIAALFGAHAQEYQALSAQMGTFHRQFVQTLTNAGEQYALAEAAEPEAPAVEAA